MSLSSHITRCCRWLPGLLPSHEDCVEPLSDPPAAEHSENTNTCHAINKDIHKYLLESVPMLHDLAQPVTLILYYVHSVCACI